MGSMEATTKDQAVGKKLRGLRAEKGMSQEDLAKLSGISESAIFRIEKGERSPRLGQLDALCDALEIDLYDFLVLALGKPVPPPTPSAE